MKSGQSSGIESKLQSVLNQLPEKEAIFFRNLLIRSGEAFSLGYKEKNLNSHPPRLSLTININTDKLVNTDIDILRRLFTYLIQSKEKSNAKIAMLTFDKPFKSFKNVESVTIIPSLFNLSISSIKESFQELDKNDLLKNPIIFMALHAAMTQTNLPTSLTEWRKLIYKYLNDGEADLELGWDDSYASRLLTNMLYLYSAYENITTLELLIPPLVRLLINTNNIALLQPWLAHYPIINDVIYKMNGHPYFFFHEAISAENQQSFHELIANFGGHPFPQYDTDGRSLLHLCIDVNSLRQALRLTTDINHQDNLGDTALHLAAYEGHTYKTRFLLMNGANPNIKNKNQQTFWDVEPFEANKLLLYRLYKRVGNVLKLPPEIIMQKGINCGIYAVACATTFHYHHSPQMFKNPPLPARKKDVTPKASASLRQLRHELGIPGKGSIFSTDHLQKMIEKTECSSIVIDIHNYDDFMDVIKKAIESNFPVIIPFSVSKGTEGHPNPEPSADTAHWATVIGWAARKASSGILLAQYGTYYDVKADTLFKSFYDIGPVASERYLHKKKGHEWGITAEPVAADADTQTGIMPLTKLDNFRRRLVIVLPPGHQWDLRMDTEENQPSSPKAVK